MLTARNIPLTIAAYAIAGTIALATPDASGNEKATEGGNAVDRRGDAARGKALFADPARAGCIRCHRVAGEGGRLGPDLSGIGGKFGREHLIESIIEPSRQVVEGYRQAVIATADGRIFAGIIKAETDTSLTLVDADSRTHLIRKAEVEERKLSDVSLMPRGLALALSRDEFEDLLEYLQGLREGGQSPRGGGPLGSIPLPAGFSATGIVDGLSAATSLAIAADGRVFICEQTGDLRVVKGGRLLPEPFVSLRVDPTWERGLIGVALDPDFGANGLVYLTYVSPDPYPHHVVGRFAARGDVAEPGSEVVLLRGDDQGTLGGPVPSGHQGGALHFGRDGKLYIAIGDQTAGAPSQRLDTFQGKLLRINRDGTIPDDNPFFATARGKYRAIWALGFRNPFTFAVQPGTGRIFVNDVGQDAREEVDEAVSGANYGWPESEGATTDPRFRGPIHAYPAASIAGGAFGPAGPTASFPPRYRGKYFFMDFVKGWIKALDPDRPAVVEDFAGGLARPVDLAFGPDGDLYVLVRDAWVIDDKYRPRTGSLIRIRHTP